MSALWTLPTRAVIGGKSYDIHGDFRDILEIFRYLDDPQLPVFLRWRIALALFYEPQLPEKDLPEGTQYLIWFVNGGAAPKTNPDKRLLDWEQDALAIVADVNRVAGCEIRRLTFLHWWTFLAWFHSIGEGQLSTLVRIRRKLRQGKKLDEEEAAFYRENPEAVKLAQRDGTIGHEKQALLDMLERKERGTWQE